MRSSTPAVLRAGKRSYRTIFPSASCVFKDNKSTNRILLKMTEQNGCIFGLMAPEYVNKDIIPSRFESNIINWLESVLNDNVHWGYELIDSLSNIEYSCHLVMYPETDDEFEIFISKDLDANTDDAIYEWITDHFKSTNYKIV